MIDALDDAENVSLAAVTALCVMPSTLVDGPVIEGLEKHDGPMRAELIDLVVARRMTAAVPLLLQFAKREGDAAAGDDVYSALDVLGDEETLARLVAIILGTEDGALRDKIRRTYLQIARRHDNTVEPILAAMTDDAATIALLPVLGWAGGQAAEARIEKALASSKVDLRAAGVGALSHWPDASVAGKLVELVKGEKDQGVRVEALRAYIRVASVFDDRPGKETLQMLQWAFGKAERTEEKNLVTRRVSSVRTLETLRWLVTLLDNEVVAKEACRSIVELARHRELSDPNRDEFVKALRRVVELNKDAQTVSHAKAFIGEGK